ncbi:TetR/AcrR family transcriptional regulator [Sphingobium bisphenolivorans]|uniref:TetR/AcrR family transcriptional regulator n=1 Tax=Sphingobium bisphenolivorans TaxID=1335760 RepID=UPI00039A9509|nr:TetR/AcrR family transcriptional regulator [Sphingobium bisphenolivorans]
MGIAGESRPGKGEIARERIKGEARRLFAQYGIDTVTIRDIAKAAGQRNGGSVNYYFRCKEDLVLEVLNDAARELDTIRGRQLDALEESNNPITLRAIMTILVLVDGFESDEQMRLFTMLQIYRRDSMHSEIPGKWDQAYQRCVAYLRGLIPDYPEKLFKQRLYFLIPYIWTFMATREGGSGQAKFWQEFWADPSTLENFLDTAEAMLLYPPSAAALSALGPQQAS